MSDSPRTDRTGGLFDPFTRESLTLPNRVVFPAMITNFGTPEGLVTPRSLAFYEARARGGAGLIILEATSVSAHGRSSANMLSLHSDDCLAGLPELVNALKLAGSRVFIQLTHAGANATPDSSGLAPGSASAAPAESGHPAVRELSTDEIETIVADFVSAAARAARAGFDGVQFCADRGDLMQQFLSPATNRRNDAFGGPLSGRMRLLCRVIELLRIQLGPAYPILVRLPSHNEAHGGLSLLDLQELARTLEALGVWGLEVGQAVDFPPSVARLVMPERPVARASSAQDIKGIVRLPVIDEGNVRDLKEAADIVRRGLADLVAIGRPLVTDPDLIVKATTSPGEATPCIYDNACRGGGTLPMMWCPANPMVGRELEYVRARRTGALRKLFVIGAGLAGLQAAALAARLGFQVTLHEETGLLGGLLVLRARIPAQSDNYRIIDHLSRLIVRLNIKLRLHSSPTVERLLAESPHAVIIARRGPMLKPAMSGLDNVRAADPAQVLAGELEVGQKVCVVGSGLLAAEIAYFLAHRSKTVTLINLPGSSEGWDRKLQRRNLRAFQEMEGKVVDSPDNIEINNYGELIAVAAGRTLKVQTDTVVLAHGYETVDNRYDALQRSVQRFYPVGDAYESLALTQLVYRATQAVLDLAGEGAVS